MIIILLIFLLTSNALTKRGEISIYNSRITILALLSVSYLAYNSLSFTTLDKGIGLFGALFNVSALSHVFTIFICLVTSIILTLTGFYPIKLYKGWSNLYKFNNSILTYNGNALSTKSGREFRIIEYALITVFVISGGIFLMTSADLISLFLSIELQSYGLYIISTIYRDSELATSSGLLYFLLGGLSSCFILLGSALLYTITGTTNLDNIYLMINMCDSFNTLTLLSDPNITNPLYDFLYYKLYYIQVAIIVILVGFLFKVSAAPFHFWSPDVYDGIPTIVTTFVAIVGKISIFVYLLDFIYQTQTSLFNFTWTSILVLSSLLSLVVGSILGLTQFRIKRLFAYSTISHVGFILLALSINSPESIQSYIFYILQYSLSNLLAFLILLCIGYTLYVDKEKENNELVDRENSPLQLVSQIKGYFYINPFIAISLSITLFSFIGIPPIVGFFGKQMILSAALDNGYVFMSLLAILTSVIGAGYYLNLIKTIFFFKEEDKAHTSIVYKELKGFDNKKSLINENFQNIVLDKYRVITLKESEGTINSSLSALISIMTLLNVLFIYIPGESFNLVNILAFNLFKI